MENVDGQARTAQKMTQFRWKVALFIFLISFIAYMDRVNLSVATPVIMQEFGFNKVDMGFIQTCFFAGYALMQVPGGIIAEKFGLRKTGTVAMFWWSFFTALTATATTKLDFAAVRFAFGIGEGPVFPALGQTAFKWFNSNEKGKASSAILAGVFFGPVVGPAVTVGLITVFGWHEVFLIFGGAGILLSFIWHRCLTDDPADNKHVNAAETAYINLGRNEASYEKKVAPWHRLICNLRFWAVGIQFMVVDYIMYVFLAWLPLYLTEAHGLSLKSMGFWASLPWLALTATVLLAGWFSDKLAMGVNKQRQYTMRTVSAVIGIVVTSVGLIMAANTSSVGMNIFWMTVSLGFLGFCMSASWSSVISLGGRYTGSVSGWINLWGNIGGILAPIGTAFLVEAYGWDSAFITTALFGIVVIVCWLFVKPGKALIEEEAIRE
jgi:ACS family glucarate transporter-like MFS transporter